MSKPPLKILFKYPSRSRPDRFFRGLDSIYNNVQDPENFHVLVSLDADDKTMANQEIHQKIMAYGNIEVYYGFSKSKIDAVNRDISLTKYPYDVIAVHSDDMVWQFYGFDTVLRMLFEEHGLDILAHVPDTDAKSALATYYIAGREYFNRFGYVYHPSYSSLWSDNEVMEVAKRLGRYRYCDCSGMLFHEHPSYGHTKFDQQYTEQQLMWEQDEKNFYSRKAKNFDL